MDNEDAFLKFIKLLQPMEDQIKYGLIYNEIMIGEDEELKKLMKAVEKISSVRQIPFLTLLMAICDLGEELRDLDKKES